MAEKKEDYGSVYDDEKTDQSMEAVDPEEYKKMLEQPKPAYDNSDNLEEMAAPIEVKSNMHILIQQEQQEKQQAKKDMADNAKTAAKEVFDWFESLLMAVVVIVLIFTFIIRVNTVDGTSMVPTLKSGQKLVVTDLFYTPAYNDIVIIQAARLDGGKPIVKRVIGLPGDTVRIDFEKGLVYRNGQQLEITQSGGYIYEDGHKINSPTNRNLEMISNKDYVVPENSYFVLGDNRNGSKDSRLFSSIGFIEKEYIAGRAVFSLFPLDTFGVM